MFEYFGTQFLYGAVHVSYAHRDSRSSRWCRKYACIVFYPGIE